MSETLTTRVDPAAAEREALRALRAEIVWYHCDRNSVHRTYGVMGHWEDSRNRARIRRAITALRLARGALVRARGALLMAAE